MHVFTSQKYVNKESDWCSSFLDVCMPVKKTLRQHPPGINTPQHCHSLTCNTCQFFFSSTFLEIALSRAEVSHINSCTEARAQRKGTTCLHSQYLGGFPGSQGPWDANISSPTCVYCILEKTFRGGERGRRGWESNVITISIKGSALLY